MTAPVKVWRHVLHGDPKVKRWWAVVFLDSTGNFAATSDFGGYGYWWSHHGCADFREFLIQISDDWDYAVSKLSPGREYDGERTLRHVKQVICESRRRMELSRDQARREWDLLEDHYDLDNVVSFGEWSRETQLADGWDMAHRSHDGDAIAFCKDVLPKLAEVLRAELAAERAAATAAPAEAT